MEGSCVAAENPYPRLTNFAQFSAPSSIPFPSVGVPVLGGAVMRWEGFSVGAFVGSAVGSIVGGVVGSLVGLAVGSLVATGASVGSSVPTPISAIDGGFVVGLAVRASVGSSVGGPTFASSIDGGSVGFLVEAASAQMGRHSPLNRRELNKTKRRSSAIIFFKERLFTFVGTLAANSSISTSSVCVVDSEAEELLLPHPHAAETTPTFE
mmetsp:Transcript_16675/g.18668  ORF Transcript_16675/g.18668 Transcript_16675/m.18668 type:complete len:209 (+) Transcript_16675:208-834(+)